MKRLRLVSAALAAAIGVTVPARADLPVVDVISNAMHLKELAQWVEQLQAMKQQYDQLTQTYYALAHITDIGSAIGALTALGITNPLPISPQAALNLIHGRGGAQGMLGSLESLYTGSTTVGGANSNRVYEATGTSWNAQEINRNALGLAGSESLAMQLYKSAADRAALLPGLQALLGVTADPSERETLANRISIEQTWIANQQVQAQAVAAAAQTQIAGRDQRREEQMQQGIDAILQDAQAHGVAGAAP